MASREHSKRLQRRKRAMRVRRKLHGTTSRPRMTVVKSNTHLSVQLIDDDAGKTMAGMATYGKELRGTEFAKKSRKAARKLGERIAEMAQEKNISEVIFDRGGFKYHGVLAELADAARAGGLRF